MADNVVVTKSLEIDGWTVRVDEDDTPRVLDVVLAEHLGYERPRDVRKLIERLKNGQNLADSEVCATVSRTSAKGGRPATEYWLTEEQALYVAAKSETTKADAILKQIIRVFVAARKGLLPQQQQPAPVLDVEGLTKAIVEAIAVAMVPIMVQLATRVAAQVSASPRVNAEAPKDQIAAIREYIYHAACYRLSSGVSKDIKSARAKVESDLRDRVKWFGRGSQLRRMPPDLAAQALHQARLICEDEQKRANAIHENRPTQLSLALVDDDKKLN
jgi:hypothetical protein